MAASSADEHDNMQDTPNETSEAMMLHSGSKIEAVAGTSGRSYKSNLAGASLSLITALLPIYFLYFATLAFQQNGQPLEGNSQANWLLDAAAFVRVASAIGVGGFTDYTQGPSVFPIVFTAIVGQLMTSIASWRLERSVAVGLLEGLLASRSLGSAFLSLFRLRIVTIWTPAMLLTWCLSPLGGQSALRGVSSMLSPALSQTTFYHLPTTAASSWAHTLTQRATGV